MKNKKLLVLVAAIALLLCVAVGGTLAWLQDDTTEITNTFTKSDVDINLDEEAGKNADYKFKMVPGGTITKDPKVTVATGSEDCWVFVKVTKSANYSTFMEDYKMATDSEGKDLWEEAAEIDENTVVYRYKTVSKAGDTLQILKDNAVKVKTDVKKSQMATLTDATNPTLEFDAYAIQSANLVDADGKAIDAANAAAVWALVDTTP